MSELEKLSLMELRSAAKNAGIRSVTTFKKKELIEKMKEAGITDTEMISSQAGVTAVKSREASEKGNKSSEKSTEKKSRGRKTAAGESSVGSRKKAEENENKQNVSSSLKTDKRKSHSSKKGEDEAFAEIKREPEKARYSSEKQNYGGYERRNQNQKGQSERTGRRNSSGGARGHQEFTWPQESQKSPHFQENQNSPHSQENQNSQRTQEKQNRSRSQENQSYIRSQESSGMQYQKKRPASRSEEFEHGGYTSRYAAPSDYSINVSERNEKKSQVSGKSYNYRQESQAPDNSQVNTINETRVYESSRQDPGEQKSGILEVLSEGYGFVRCENFLPGENDVYVSPAMIRKFGLRTGDMIEGISRNKNSNDKYGALLYITKINGNDPASILGRAKFENLTPVFPNERIRLETPDGPVAMRMMDLISPIGKGQRGMIVSQPKTGKTTLIKQAAKAVKHNYPKMHIIVLLIDERPEEVTDMKESILGGNVEVIYSTFDEMPENHKRVSEMVLERAKRLVEQGEDVIILLDSITRLARAYNLTCTPSGRTLSGGLDPAALYMPKKFFGAARNMREGGSLTILATALVDTGSRMDDVVFEEFKGTGNMELVLDRSLSERRVFPAINLQKSSTRREDLLLRNDELEAVFLMRKAFSGVKGDEAVEKIIKMFKQTKDNHELINMLHKVKIVNNQVS